MNSLRLSDRTMSYDAGLNLVLHKQPPNHHLIEAEAGTIILNPHNGATIKGKNLRKKSTGKSYQNFSFPVIFTRKKLSSASPQSLTALWPKVSRL